MKVPRTKQPAGRVLAVLLALTALLTLAATVGAQLPPRQQEGTDLTGGVRDRDNTRVTGMVYGPEGEPLTDVDIWVSNDDAPAHRLRAKSRKTGSYLVRNMVRLYTEHNLQGINLRLSFEKPGYQTVETRIGVARNELATVSPILWPEGVEPRSPGARMLLSGRIEDARGKPVSRATVTVTVAGDGERLAETTAAKGGEYELLLWDVPEQLELEVTPPGGDPVVRPLTVEAGARADLVLHGSFDVALEG